MLRVFSRRVADDFEAESMIKCMLDADCEIISVCFSGMHRHPNAVADTARFTIFSKAMNRGQIDQADEAFGNWLNGLTRQTV